MTYEDAVAALHRVSLSEFVSERKRLAAELKSSGDKEGSARLLKLPRPTVSAWAVNQLWWHEQAPFERLLAAAERIKSGERDANKVHRDALAELRDHAARLLHASGNAASETTLRRVAATLSAIAAAGGFDPDPPGALSADRDPPGFESLLLGASPTTSSDGATASQDSAPRKSEAEPSKSEAERREAEAKRREAEAKRREAEAKRREAEAKRREAEAKRREAEAERRKAEEAERERRQAERERLTAARRQAREALEQRNRELGRLRAELARAEQGVKEAEALLARVDDELAAL